jgi:hypothetical protein
MYQSERMQRRHDDERGSNDDTVVGFWENTKITRILSLAVTSGIRSTCVLGAAVCGRTMKMGASRSALALQ